MKAFLKSIAFYTLMLTAAISANSPGAVISPLPLANVAAITGPNGHWGPSAPTLKTCGYYACGDGGDNTYTYSSTSCTVDGGSCIRDVDGNYYTATITGDIRQYGATFGSPYDYLTHGTGATDISPVLTAMTTAMAAHSLTLININAISVYMATSFSIPANMIVNCGSAIGQPDTGLWYNNTPSTIYEAHGTSLHLAGRNSGLQNCRVYSQPVVATKPVGAQQVQAMNALMVSNGDTLAYCDDDNCNFNNVELMGGDTCLETASADASILDNVDTDCNVNFYVHSIGGTVKWSKTQGDVYLNKNLTPKREDFTITSITVGSGNTCKVTVTPQSGAALADLAYATYIYISSLSDGPSICEGRWHVQNVDTVAGTFELVGSVVGNPTGGPSTFGHWANNSSVIYISDGTNVANGTSINGLAGSGIPNATMAETPWQLPPPVGPWIADTGAANAYVANATSDLQPCTLQDSLNVSFTAAHSNTAASTLNITLRTDVPAGCGGGATGPIAIVRNDGTDLQANDITANANELVHYCVDLSTQCVASAVNKWVLIQPRVVLDTNKTTAAQSSNVAITFLGAVCSGGGCGTAPEASIIYATRVDAGASAGGVAAGGTGAATCYMIGGPHDKRINSDGDTVAGFQDVNGFCYDHSRFFHFQNANEAWVGDLGTDSHGGDDDPNPIILLVDGDSNNIHIVGRKAGKGGRPILVNLARPDSSDRGCVTWLGAAVAATKGFLPVSTVEQGCLLMVGGVTNSGGVNLVGHFANAASYSSVYQPNVTNYAEDSVALSALNTIGSYFEGGQSNPIFIANMAPVKTANASIDSTAVFWRCDATSGNVQLTLPVAATVGNQQFTVQKVDTSTNTCKVVPGGSDTFLGGTTNITLGTQGQQANFASSGSTLWYIYPVIAPGVIAQSGAVLTVPADTTEDTLATIILPRNTMGANGCFIVDILSSYTASANAKTLRLYFGSTGTTAFASAASTALVTGTRLAAKVCNANATNAQVGVNITGLQGLGSAITGAVDTTSNANIIITGQKASAGETLKVTNYNITVTPYN